ncbi:hypothetical protein [Nocardioides nanhaiensis]|uniref:Uncharacterized protein n=1 Tax=Nocardioides nanhaiensis TaxID=1476871 RepID=A0ABP8VRY6_9ACTN
MDHLDLSDHLERLAAHEPPVRPAHEHLAAGRRALRRRRVAELGAVTAVLAVLVGGWAVVGDGGSSRATEPPAAPPTTSRAPMPPPEGEWAQWQDGAVRLADGVEELDRIDAGRDGVGLELRAGDDVRWYLVDRRRTTSFDAYVAFDSLADWVSDQTFPGGPAARAALVRLAPDGTLAPGRPGVEIIEQVASPDLPDSYDGGNLVTAAALVEVDGERTWLLARDPAATDVITVALARASTLDDFLAFARERYADGPGGGSEGML